MKGKFLFFGEPMTLPGIPIPLAFSIFKLWLCPTGGSFRGYTSGSNTLFAGYALLETPIVDFRMAGLHEEEPFFNLHGSTVDITLTTNTFVGRDGIATIRVVRRTNDAGAAPQVLTFLSDECTGGALTAGDIRLTTTLRELPAAEFDPTGRNYLGL